MLPFVSTRAFDRQIQLAVEITRKELATDRVAHVMGQEHHRLQARVPGYLHRLIGIAADAVPHIRFGREAEAEEVEQHDASLLRERREHRAPVERTRREAVEDEERRLTGVSLGRDVEHERVESVDRDDATTRLPVGDGAGSGGIGHGSQTTNMIYSESTPSTSSRG